PSYEYTEYMLECDMSTAYEYQKRVMRVLQSQAPGSWALKMPSHSLHFKWAPPAFPDARFIWTHRNPFNALASLGTTISMGHMGPGQPDLEFSRKVYPHQIAEHANRPMRIRPELPDDKILDVYCADLVRDPIKEMHRVYEWLGEELDPATEKSMRAWIDTDNQRQQARPTYSLEDYGWTH